MGGIAIVVAAPSSATSSATSAEVTAGGVFTCTGHPRACSPSSAPALVGFLDDWIKVRNERNLGLSKRAKMLGLLVVAVGFAGPRCSPSPTLHTDALASPASTRSGIDLGTGRLGAVAVLLILAATNAVNLTDGLDGLAGGLGDLRLRRLHGHRLLGLPPPRRSTQTDARPRPRRRRRRDARRAAPGFLWWNAAPAQIFMGDTGSLAIGAGLAGLALTTNTAAAADHRRRPVRGRDGVGDPAGRQLPAVRRPAHLPHGADPPPLRAGAAGPRPRSSSASGSWPGCCTALGARPLLRRLRPTSRGARLTTGRRPMARRRRAGARASASGVTGGPWPGRCVRHGGAVVLVDDRPSERAPRCAERARRAELLEAPDADAAGARCVAAPTRCCPAPGVPERHPVFAAADAAGVPVAQRVRPGRARGTTARCVADHRHQRQDHRHHAGHRDARARPGAGPSPCGNTEVPLVAAIDDPATEVFVVEASSFRLGHSRALPPAGGDLAELRPRPPRRARRPRRLRGGQGPASGPTTAPTATSPSPTPTTRWCCATATPPARDRHLRPRRSGAGRLARGRRRRLRRPRRRRDRSRWPTLPRAPAPRRRQRPGRRGHRARRRRRRSRASRRRSRAFRGLAPPGRAGRRGRRRALVRRLQGHRAPRHAGRRVGLRLGRAHRRRPQQGPRPAACWPTARRRTCGPSSPSATPPTRSPRRSPAPARSSRAASMADAVAAAAALAAPGRRRACCRPAARRSTGTAPTASGATTSPGSRPRRRGAGTEHEDDAVTTTPVDLAPRPPPAAVPASRRRRAAGRRTPRPRCAVTGLRSRARSGRQPSPTAPTTGRRPCTGRRWRCSSSLVAAQPASAWSWCCRRRRSSPSTSPARPGTTSPARRIWTRARHSSRSSLVMRASTTARWRTLQRARARSARSACSSSCSCPASASRPTAPPAGSATGPLQHPAVRVRQARAAALRGRPAGPAGRADRRLPRCTPGAGAARRSASWPALIMLQPNLGTTIDHRRHRCSPCCSSPARRRGRSALVGRRAASAAAVGGLHHPVPAGRGSLALPRPVGRRRRAPATRPSQAQVGARPTAACSARASAQGRAKWGFLPEAHTDFIFAVIGEELGLVGGLLVVALFLALARRRRPVGACRRRDRFGAAAGHRASPPGSSSRPSSTSAVRRRSCPITGVPLPFVSFGGSSLLSPWSRPGMLLNIARADPLMPRGRRAASTAPATYACIAGGGTAGHVLPGLAVARALVGRGPRRRRRSTSSAATGASRRRWCPTAGFDRRRAARAAASSAG